MFRNEFIKFDEKVNLCVYLWDQVDSPKGCVQLAHGMAEHLARYDEFAMYLNSLGFIVIGADHYAHGKSVDDLKKIGVVEDYDFMTAILNSIKLVRTHYDALFQGAKVLFAHSMGSMAAQRYIELYPQDFEKVVISGTDYPAGKYGFAKLLTSSSGKVGRIKYSKFIDGLGVGSFNKGLEKEHPKLAWLSTNRDNYLKYEQDPMCGAMFPNNYYHSLACMLLTSVKKEERAKINKDLLVFIMAGALDPVGGKGKGPKKLADDYEKLLGAERVKLTLYPNARHECLNEVPEIKEQVYADIATFLAL